MLREWLREPEKLIEELNIAKVREAMEAKEEKAAQRPGT
jgi:hypothetical protein